MTDKQQEQTTVIFLGETPGMNNVHTHLTHFSKPRRGVAS